MDLSKLGSLRLLAENYASDSGSDTKSEGHASPSQQPPGELASPLPASGAPQTAAPRTRFIKPGKDQPYASGRHTQGFNVADEIDLSDTEADHTGSKDPNCRQYAAAYFAAPSKGAHLDQHMASKAAIKDFMKQRVADLEELRIHTWRNAPPEAKHLVEVAGPGFGLMLQDVGQKIRTMDPPEANMLIHTGNHELAAFIQIKDPGPNERFVLRVYDPNVTGNHQSEQAYTPEGLGGRSFKDLVPDWHKYGGHAPQDTRPMMVSVVTPGVAFEGGTVGRYVGTETDSSSLESLRSQLVAAVDSGMTLHMADITQKLADKGLSGRAAADFLNVKDEYGDNPVKRAIPELQTASMKALATMAQTLGVTGEHAQRLLGSPNDDGMTPVFYALMSSPEILRSVTQVAQQLGLTGTQFTQLLSAQSPDGDSGLSAAMMIDHVPALGAVQEALQAFGIDGAQAARIMQAPVQEGNALSLLLQTGKTQMINAWAATSKALNIQGDDAKRLLSTLDVDGQSGLTKAAMSGQADALRAWGQAAKTLGLTANDVSEKITEPDGHGASTYQMIRDHGTDGVKTALSDVLRMFVP